MQIVAYFVLWFSPDYRKLKLLNFFLKKNEVSSRIIKITHTACLKRSTLKIKYWKEVTIKFSLSTPRYINVKCLEDILTNFWVCMSTDRHKFTQYLHTCLSCKFWVCNFVSSMLWTSYHESVEPHHDLY